MPRIEVVHGTDLKAGDVTDGIRRDKAFETDTVLVSQTRLDRGAISGWHHHGTHDLYGFVVSGRLRLEYGPNGTEAAAVSPGDFFHVPRGLVHRDVSPDPAHGVVVVSILVGSGVPVVNVESP